MTLSSEYMGAITECENNNIKIEETSEIPWWWQQKGTYIYKINGEQSKGECFTIGKFGEKSKKTFGMKILK